MKLYEITIQPLAGFGTDLKGDTIFGHFCWQAAHDPSLLEGGLEAQISNYQKIPFAVFSTAFPKLVGSTIRYVLKRPDMPLHFLLPPNEVECEERHRKAKEHKKRSWMVVGEDLAIDLSAVEFIDSKELFQEVESLATLETRRRMRRVDQTHFMASVSQPHNTINRLTQTTGTGLFAPYTQEVTHYYPETELVIFVLIDETATDIERVLVGLERIGRWGYGRDASIGMGRFKLADHNELPAPSMENANACYTLAPCVPEKDCFRSLYFTPFTRFGKHGDRLAGSRNPFKNPVIMADEGAVLEPKNGAFFEKPYLGRAVTDVSKSEPATVHQGYSIYLPLRLEG